MFDQEYAGCGIWGFNSTTGAYECVWCDTAACMILFERGSFDEDKKVYIADSSFISPTTGQIMRRRSVVTVRSNDEHVLETYLGPEPDADELLQANESGSNPFESAPEVLRVSSLDDTFDAPKVMEIRFSRRS